VRKRDGIGQTRRTGGRGGKEEEEGGDDDAAVAARRRTTAALVTERGEPGLRLLLGTAISLPV